MPLNFVCALTFILPGVFGETEWKLMDIRGTPILQFGCVPLVPCHGLPEKIFILLPSISFFLNICCISPSKSAVRYVKVTSPLIKFWVPGTHWLQLLLLNYQLITHVRLLMYVTHRHAQESTNSSSKNFISPHICCANGKN